ncbi:MAG: hypothetical protein JJU18_09180 [Oceanicaulis sp.]|nr:hypothetical protein [Oceanicaulis sp.]
MEDLEITVADKDGNAISVPSSAQSFARFLHGLIAPSDHISRIFSGRFEIYKADMAQLYHMIVQRVSEQNKGAVLSSRFRFRNENDRIQSINSISSFEKTAEISDKEVDFIGMEVVFAIDDSEAGRPVKHVVEISFSSTISGIPMLNKPNLDIDRIYRSAVYVNVSYGLRTWSEDIMNLCSNFIKDKVEQPHPVKKFIGRNSLHIATLFSTLMFAIIMGIIMAIPEATFYIRIPVELYENNSQAFSLISPINLIAAISGGIFALMIFMVAAIFSSQTAMDFLASSPRSAIILTERQDRNYKSYKSKRLARYQTLFWGIIASLLVGVLLNILMPIFVSN